MRKPILSLLLLSVSTLSAPAALAQDDPFVTRADRARVTLTPPAGFEVAKQFQGYRQPTTGALIRVAHLSMTYDDARKALSRELLAARGATERTRDEVRTADGRTSTLIGVERRQERLDLREMMLLIGDADGSALVTATYAAVYESQLRTPLRMSLLSTRWAAKGAATPRPAPVRPSVPVPPPSRPSGATPPPPPPIPVPPVPAPPRSDAEPPPTPEVPQRPEPPQPAPSDQPAVPDTRAPPKPVRVLPRPDRRGGPLREEGGAKPVDPAALVAQLPFSVGESRLLVTRRALGGGLSLAASGKEGRWSDPLFSVFSRERAVPPGPGRSEFVARLVEQSGAFASVVRESSEEIRIDDLDGIRAVALGTFEGGGDALVFKVVLFDADDYYALTGRCAASERGTYLGEFDRLAQSFRRADWAR